jgi:hypothetical protein
MDPSFKGTSRKTASFYLDVLRSPLAVRIPDLVDQAAHTTQLWKITLSLSTTTSSLPQRKIPRLTFIPTVSL